MLEFQALHLFAKKNITAYVAWNDLRSLGALARASKSENKLCTEQLKIAKYLKLVAENNIEQVVDMLDADHTLVLKAGSLIDKEGREFRDITGFQYVVWSFNSKMWAAMQPYFDKCNHRTNARQEQFQTLLDTGTSHGVSFSWHELFEAYDKYIQMFTGFTDDSARHKHWKLNIYPKLNQLPEHIQEIASEPHLANFDSDNISEERYYSASEAGALDSALYNANVTLDKLKLIYQIKSDHFRLLKQGLFVSETQGQDNSESSSNMLANAAMK